MDIATTLLEYGAKANAESKAGFTPLHLSAQEGHMDMTSMLIDYQADTNHKAKNGLTPLHLCAQEDRVNVASVLVKNGAEVDATTKAGYTPLHVACHFGQLNMVRFLLDEGSQVGSSTAVGYTPLHQAAQQGHCAIVNTLLERGAPPNATTNQGQTAMSIAQKLGYISVVETLKGVTEPTTITPSGDEKYKVVSPETMQETFMSDSEDEGGEDTLLSEQPYRYLTVDEMKSLGDDSLPIDVRQDERLDSNRECMTVPPTAVDDTISPQHLKEAYSQFNTPDNIDISKHPLHVGFLVSFLVDARGGAMRGCRHSGVRVIVPPRRASMPMRVTCRYLKRDKLSHPPPLMEGEALASRILELGPVGAKFLGPVMIEVPHFGSLRGKEREIVILRSDNGETWREHTVDCSEEAVQDVLSHSFDKEEMAQLEDNARTTRILTTDFPHYFAVVTRVRQEVHAIGPEGGMVSSSVVPQVQAVFPQGALTKKIKVGLQAQPISAELAAKLLGNRVAVSPIVTVEPRRRKFHKPITLTIPKPQAANKGMINQYSGDAPTLRLLCSITGGTTRAQWEDVTGSTPFTFVNDCVSFTTTVSARFWLMDCRNVGDATKMATELYREAIHVPFMAKFVVFAKRVDPLEARLRIFCMTDDKEDKTLEHQEHFTEVAKSRDVEVLEGKTQYIEFAGNLVPVTKSGEQLQLGFRAFRENRLPFTVRVKDPHADCVGRTLFMREARLPKGEPPQQPICVLNIVLPEEIIPEAILPEHELHKYSFIQDSSGLESYQRVDLRLSDISNLLGADWVRLAEVLDVAPSDINRLKTEHPQSVAQQGLAMLRLWLSQAGNKAQASTLESALSQLGRDDIVQQCVFNVDHSGLQLLKDESRDASIRRSIPYSDKDIMKDSESVEDLSRMSLRKTGDIGEKDDKEERKYEAEEKEVDDIKKSVSDRRKEIEKRLSLDKQLEKKAETIIDKVKTEKSEDLSEKEIAEEKRVSSPEEEPSELSFEQKRLSFEQGKRVIEMKPDKTTMKEVKEKADERFLAEERRAAEALQDKKAVVDETSLSFQEKKKSFEHGLKEEKEKEKREEVRKEELRRDSALFEGVSQGLVRLDAAFAVTPQVQGTVAWTEETQTSAVVPVKPDQSQDWAEKGKPDSAIDPSHKGASRIVMKEDIRAQYEDNKNSISVTSKPTDIKSEKDLNDKNTEKESKYQFTMSVPDKKAYTETLNSIRTFLDSEKNYNNLTVTKRERLIALADTEVTSSDETEESQSRSESEPKSDKSFMGKMSKKLFGVFKKDDKERSDKKKGKKKKHKKDKSDKDDTTDEEHKQSIEKGEAVMSVIKPFKGAKDKTLSVTGTVLDKAVKINEENKSQAVDVTKKAIKTTKDVTNKTISETGIIVQQSNEKLDEGKTSADDVNKLVYDSIKGERDKIIPITESITDEAEEVIKRSKTMVVDTTKATTEIVEDVYDKTSSTGREMHSTLGDIARKGKKETVDVVNIASATVKTISDTTTSTIKEDMQKVRGTAEEGKSKASDAKRSAEVTVAESVEKSKIQLGNVLNETINITEKGKTKVLDVSKGLYEMAEEAEGKIKPNTVDGTDQTEKYIESAEPTSIATGEAVSKIKEKPILIAIDTAGITKDTTKEGKPKASDVTKSASNLVTTTVSIAEIVVDKTGTLAEEGKFKLGDTVKATNEAARSRKEKTKSFFSGFFSKSSDTSDEEKNKEIDKNIVFADTVVGKKDQAKSITGEKRQLSEDLEVKVINKPESQDATAEKVKDNKVFEKNVTTERVEEKENEEKTKLANTNKTANDMLASAEHKVEDGTDTSKQTVEVKIKDFEITKTSLETTKATKEKSKSFFGGFFSKSSEISDEEKYKDLDSKTTMNEAVESTKDKIKSVTIQTKDTAGEIAEDVKTKVISTTKDMSQSASEKKEDAVNLLKGVVDTVGEKVLEGKAKTTYATKSASDLVTSTAGGVVDKAGKIAEENKSKVVDTTVVAGETVKVTKEKTKSFFGGFFSKSGEAVDDFKDKDADTKIEVVTHIKSKPFKVISTGAKQSPVLAQKDKTKDVEFSVILNDTEIEATDETSVPDKFSIEKDPNLVIKDVMSKSNDITKSNDKSLKENQSKTLAKAEKGGEEVNITVEETVKPATDQTKGTKEKNKSFFSSIFSKAGDIVDEKKSKVVDTTVSISESAVRAKDKTESVSSDILKKGDNLVQGTKTEIVKTISTVGEKTKHAKDKSISFTSDVVDKTSKDIKSVKAGVIASTKNKTEATMSGINSLTSAVTDKTEETIDLGKTKVTETGKVVVDATRESQEKTKSPFVSMFKKAEETSDDNLRKISHSKTGILQTAGDIKDNKGSVIEGIIDKTVNLTNDEKVKMDDTTNPARELISNVEVKTVPVTSSMIEITEEIKAGGKNEHIEQIIENPEKKGATIIDETVDIVENIVQDGQSRVRDANKSISESVKGTKEKTKSFIGSLFGKSEEILDVNKVKLSAVATPKSKLVGDDATHRFGESPSVHDDVKNTVISFDSQSKEQKDLTKSGMTSTTPLHDKTSDISGSSVDDTTLEIDETVDLAKPKVQISKTIPEKEKSKKDKEKTLFSGMFSKAHDSTTGLSNVTKETTDKVVSAAESIVEHFEKGLKEGKGKVVDTTKIVTDISRDATDKTKSVGSTFTHKTEQIVDGGETKVVETTTVTDKTTSLADDIANKTTKIVSETVNVTKDSAKSLFGSMFSKGDKLDNNETAVPGASKLAHEEFSYETEKHLKIGEDDSDSTEVSLKSDKYVDYQTSSMSRRIIEKVGDVKDDIKDKLTDETKSLAKSAIVFKDTTNTLLGNVSLKAKELVEDGKIQAVDSTININQTLKDVKNKTVSVVDDITNTAAEEMSKSKTKTIDGTGKLIKKTKDTTSSVAGDIIQRTDDIADVSKVKGEITSKSLSEAARKTQEETKSFFGSMLGEAYENKDSKKINFSEPLISKQELLKESEDKRSLFSFDVSDINTYTVSGGKGKAENSTQVIVSSLEGVNSNTTTEGYKVLTDVLQISSDQNTQTKSKLTENPVIDECSKLQKEETKSRFSDIFSKDGELIDDGKSQFVDKTKPFIDSVKGIKEKSVTFGGEIIDKSVEFSESGRSKDFDSSNDVSDTVKDVKDITSSIGERLTKTSENEIDKREASATDILKTVAIKTKEKTEMITIIAEEMVNTGQTKLKDAAGVQDTNSNTVGTVLVNDDRSNLTNEMIKEGKSTLEALVNSGPVVKDEVSKSGELTETVVIVAEKESPYLKDNETTQLYDSTKHVFSCLKEAAERSSAQTKDLFGNVEVRGDETNKIIVEPVGDVDETETNTRLTSEFPLTKPTQTTKSFGSLPVGTLVDGKSKVLDSTESITQEINGKKDKLSCEVGVTQKISEDVADTKSMISDKKSLATDKMSTITNDFFGKVETFTTKVKTDGIDSLDKVTQSFTDHDTTPQKTKQSFYTNQPTQAITDNTKKGDDELNKILIDMLIEQECMKSPLQETFQYVPETESANLSEKHDTEVSEKATNNAKLSGFKTAASFGKIESLIGEADLQRNVETERVSKQPYVTTPTMQRRKIGGSQRLSREERPALREVTHILDYSSSEEDEASQYIVTEPSDRSPPRKVAFQVETEDEAFLKVSDSSSEPEIEVTEMTPSPVPNSKKQETIQAEESTKHSGVREKSSSKSDNNIQKVERRFERMASQTLEADPEAKFTADRDFQRMVSQLSSEEVDACLSQWDEGGLTPSEELDSTRDTIEGDLDPDVEALPEAFLASTNPFYSPSSQWVDFEHNVADVPSSIFWAFDTAPTKTVIQPNELDIPIKPTPVKGESAGEEAKTSPGPPITRESEEALLDLASGLQDSKGSGSGPSSAK